MIIRKHGLVLTRLRREDIEMVRQHRNSEYVQSRMFYQEQISPEMQDSWFDMVNDHKHYYFIIHKEDRPIGMIHGVVHSFEEGKAEGGIFIWDETERSTVTPALASLILNDLTFFLLEMKEVFAEVRADNINAQSYNRGMGYKVTKVDDKLGKVHMILLKEDYVSRTTSLKKYLSEDKENYDLSWDDVVTSSADRERIYSKLPVHLQEMIVKRLDDGHDNI